MTYTEQDMDTLHSVLNQLNPDHSPRGVRWEYCVNINVDPEVFQTIQLRLVFCRDGTPVLCFASEVAYALNTTVHRIASQIQARLHNLYMQHDDKLADPKLLSLLSSVDVAAIPYDLVNRGNLQQAEAYASARLHSVLGCVEMNLNGEWWAAVVHNDEVAVKQFITADRKQSKTHLFKVRKVG